MKNKPLLIAIAIFLIFEISHAAPYGEKDLKPTLDGKTLFFPQLNLSNPEKCRDSVDFGAMKNSQFAICDMLEINNLDVELNKHYQAVRKALDAEQKNAITKAQKSWLKFREEWCSFEKIGPPLGLMGDALYTSCFLDIKKKQVEYLKNLAEAYHGK